MWRHFFVTTKRETKDKNIKRNIASDLTNESIYRFYFGLFIC